MINFSNLDTRENFKEKIVSNVVTNLSITKTKLNFQKDILKKKSKLNKDEIRHTEPGDKIGTGQFHSISQYCEECECVTNHAHKPEKKRMICLRCKSVYNYGK